MQESKASATTPRQGANPAPEAVAELVIEPHESGREEKAHERKNLSLSQSKREEFGNFRCLCVDELENLEVD